ncbi:MAG: hypothetical protein HN353_04765 [Bdellovibrionales bacterium]|jgi:hypothetical protein|nr:hypothetical protein [Bdellovibrionales bacterium]MBT3527402.1 hypothetical protein [Bdellovibrionales bacterium]MBT7669687.1 hypothetical protein [Bdellovibrionales bacterium]MBT7765655.1 hypothetical protein [Bdellovibrionales bacterium]
MYYQAVRSSLIALLLLLLSISASAANSQEVIIKTSAPHGLRVIDHCQQVVAPDFNQLEITLSESASSTKRVKRSLEKRIKDLIWRLGKGRGPKSQIAPLAQQLLKKGAEYQLKASYQLQIPTTVELDDLYQAFARDGGIEYEQLVQYVSPLQREKAIKHCYRESGKRVLSRAIELASQLKVKIKKQPLAVDGMEKFVSKESKSGPYLQLEMTIESRFELIGK